MYLKAIKKFDGRTVR